MSVKIGGAWALHYACESSWNEMEMFVVVSSVAVAIGNGGQGNYVAGNSGMEGVVAARRELGLCCSAVELGGIGDTGVLARGAGAVAAYNSSGGQVMSVEEGLSAVRAVIGRKDNRDGVLIAAHVDSWIDFAGAEGVKGGDRRWQRVRSSSDGGVVSGEVIVGENEEEVSEVVRGVVLGGLDAVVGHKGQARRR